jgi:hypothetical protein
MGPAPLQEERTSILGRRPLPMTIQAFPVYPRWIEAECVRVCATNASRCSPPLPCIAASRRPVPHRQNLTCDVMGLRFKIH